MDCNLPASSVHGILQARMLEWVAISSFRGSSPPRDQTHISCTGRRILYYWATWEACLPYCPLVKSMLNFYVQLQSHFLYDFFPGNFSLSRFLPLLGFSIVLKTCKILSLNTISKCLLLFVCILLLSNLGFNFSRASLAAHTVGV